MARPWIAILQQGQVQEGGEGGGAEEQGDLVGGQAEQVDEDGDARDGRIAELEATLERRTARWEKELSEHETELADHADQIAALTSQLARLSTQLANALPQSAGPGAKRPALGALPAQPVRR